MAERSLEAMKDRVKSRTAFGKLLAEQDTIIASIAQSRMEIEQARYCICLSVCLCIYVCVYVCVYVYTDMCASVGVCVCVRACVHACVRACDLCMCGVICCVCTIYIPVHKNF